MLPRLGLLGQGIELKEKQGQLNGLGCVTLKLFPAVEVSFVGQIATVDLVEVSFVCLTASIFTTFPFFILHFTISKLSPTVHSLLQVCKCRNLATTELITL